MKTQVEQINAAKVAYIVQISRAKSGMMRRYAVYLQPENGELEVLWPTVREQVGNSKPELLPGQVYSKRRDPDTIPAYHFAYRGCGFSAADELRKTLQEINPKLEVRRLTVGWGPGVTM